MSKKAKTPINNVLSGKTNLPSAGKNLNQIQRQTRKVALIGIGIAGIFAVVMFGIGLLTIRTIKKDNQETGDYNQLVAEIQQYPNSYIAAGLPQYPNGEITNLSRKDAAPKDEISVLVETTDKTESVTAYYDRELLALGWVPESQPPVDGEFYFRNYNKDNQGYSLTAQIDNETGNTTITISWRED